MDKLFGIPAHPLMVHAPVVIIPFTTLIAVLFTVLTDFRRRFFRPFIGLCFVGTVTTFLAKQSGETFDEALKGLAPVEKHAELADITMVLTVATLLASVAMFFVLRRSSPGPGADDVTGSTSVSLAERLVMLLVVVLSILASIWMIRTGHEGARVVWQK